MSKVVDKLKQLPWIAPLFGAAVFFLALLPESQQTFFQFDRNRILEGEVWRMFTGHLVHWNSSHLFWDLFVFLGCGFFLEWLQRNRVLIIILAVTLSVSTALLVFQPSLVYYRGLSAVDMGLFTAACLKAIAYCRLRNKRPMAVVWSLVLLGCFLKPFLEVATGDALFVSGFGEGIVPSPASHIFGILAVLILFMAISFWRKLLNRSDYNRSFRNHSPSEISIS